MHLYALSTFFHDFFVKKTVTLLTTIELHTLKKNMKMHNLGSMVIAYKYFKISWAEWCV